MPDTTSTAVDRTVVVHRHGALTYISLGFNALILLLILIGIAHHHGSGQRPDGGDGRAFDRNQETDHHDGAERYHHGGFGGMGHEWGHRDGFRQDGGGERCEMEGPHGDDGMDRHQDWGGDRSEFGQPPMGGFGAGGDLQAHLPPSSEEMTDRFMLMLSQKLMLTDQESGQIRPIVQNGISQLQKDMENQKQAHEKMIDDDKTKVRAMLTPDQQKTFDEMTANMGGPAPAPPK